VTELLEGALEVRGGDPFTPAALRTDAGWRRVERVVTRWVVETDWWRRPLHREYLRCLLSGGECCEIYRERSDPDVSAAPAWSWSRRYD
jgi:hypothetical protein